MAINFEEILSAKVTLTEQMLGMSPGNKEVYSEFIASKAPTVENMEDEIESFNVAEEIEKGMTVFPRLPDGTPFIWDYQIKGFLKDSIGMLRNNKKTACSALKNYKKRVDGLMFIVDVDGKPLRKIPFNLSGPIGKCERPLRAETAQGPRVALACSETVPEGSSFEFSIGTLEKDLLPVIRECLDYATLHGFGQWRNSGAGRATWEEIECSES